MTEWKTIDTAPERERVLVKRESETKQISIAKFVEGEWGEPKYWKNDAGGSVYPKPTHWMPLPEPPKKVGVRCEKVLLKIDHNEKNIMLHTYNQHGRSTYQEINYCPMTEWIKDRKPCKEDSPIIGCSKIYSVESFECAVLYWMHGWRGEGFYDHSHEYGMEINEIVLWKHLKTPERKMLDD